jgi:hypothetical protein
MSIECHYVDRKQVLEIAVQTLHHDREHLAEETRLRWEELRDQLSGTEFRPLLQRYVGMNIQTLPRFGGQSVKQ